MSHPAIARTAVLLRDVAQPVIVELGCNDCGMGRSMVEAMKRPCLYYGVEGDPRALARSRRPAGAVIVEAVAGEADGTATMRLSRDAEEKGRALGSSTALVPLPAFHAPANFAWIAFDHQIEVVKRSVDSLCREWGLDHIDLLWADIEGSEARMLQGAAEILPRVRLLYLEVWPAAMYEGQTPKAELLAHLHHEGWCTEWEDPNHVLLRNGGFSCT